MMNDLTFPSSSEQETRSFGARMAKHFRRGDIVCLFGDLGSGKTTLIKGMAQGLGIPHQHVNSPTFVLMNAYAGTYPLFHFDFYRLDDPAEIQSLGYEEFFFGQGVTVVEWAERLGVLLPPENLTVRLSHRGGHQRVIKVRGRGQRYLQLLREIRPDCRKK